MMDFSETKNKKIVKQKNKIKIHSSIDSYGASKKLI